MLMLIVLGVGIQLSSPHLINDNLLGVLKILGNIGLIFIVLEAALDLKLERSKLPVILSSFGVALVALVGSAFAIALVFSFFFEATLLRLLFYAVPLSIMSSAIIIPSVSGLTPNKKEFMVYESTFSDILGIMFFYYLLGVAEEGDVGKASMHFAWETIFTIIISVITSYVLVLLLQKLTSQVKLFLVIAALTLLYAVGKKMHLSSLLIILMFGLVLGNSRVFFRGRIQDWIQDSRLTTLIHDFHTITLESAFVIRTFFFVVFGMTITLSTLVDLNVTIISVLITICLFVVRYVCLRIFLKGEIKPELYIAPRGLITILLFFAIPDGWRSDGVRYPDDDMTIAGFSEGILLYPILITSIVMTVSLILDRGEKVQDVFLGSFKRGLPASLDNAVQQVGDIHSTETSDPDRVNRSEVANEANHPTNHRIDQPTDLSK